MRKIGGKVAKSVEPIPWIETVRAKAIVSVEPSLVFMGSGQDAQGVRIKLGPVGSRDPSPIDPAFPFKQDQRHARVSLEACLVSRVKQIGNLCLQWITFE